MLWSKRFMLDQKIVERSESVLSRIILLLITFKWDDKERNLRKCFVCRVAVKSFEKHACKSRYALGRRCTETPFSVCPRQMIRYSFVQARSQDFCSEKFTIICLLYHHDSQTKMAGSISFLHVYHISKDRQLKTTAKTVGDLSVPPFTGEGQASASWWIRTLPYVEYWASEQSRSQRVTQDWNVCFNESLTWELLK